MQWNNKNKKEKTVDSLEIANADKNSDQTPFSISNYP